MPAADTFYFTFSPSDGESDCDNYANTRLELSQITSGDLKARAEKCSGSFNADGVFQLAVDGQKISDWTDNYNAGDSGESMYVDFIERFGYPNKWYELQGWVGGNSELETGIVDLKVHYTKKSSSPPFTNYTYEVNPTGSQCSPGSVPYGALELRPSGSQIEVRVTKCQGESFNQNGVAVLWIDGKPYGVYQTYAQGDTLVSFMIDPASEGFADTNWHEYVAHIGGNAELVTGSVNARIVEQTVDTIPPGGNITSPVENSHITSNSVNIVAEAWDNSGGSGVKRVRFYVFYDSEWHHIGDDTSSPYSFTWQKPTSLVSQLVKFGIHIEDNAGNYLIDPDNIVAVYIESENNSNVIENWIPTDQRVYLNQRSLEPNGDYMCSAASATMLLAMNGVIAQDYDTMASEATAIYGNEKNALWQVAQALNTRGMTTNTPYVSTDDAWNTIKTEIDSGHPVAILSDRFTYGHSNSRYGMDSQDIYLVRGMLCCKI